MIKIRSAIPGDEKAIFFLIQELALYEKAPEQVTNSSAQLKIDLFETAVCEAIVAERDKEIIGFALYYTSYSTWKGLSLYLEDFYVKANHRKCGVGTLLFDKVVALAKEKKVKRLDWQVLEWNKLAIDFYEKKGAELSNEWTNGRICFD